VTSGGDNFNDCPENQLTKFRAQFWTSANFFQEASCFPLSMEWTPLDCVLGPQRTQGPVLSKAEDTLVNYQEISTHKPAMFASLLCDGVPAAQITLAWGSVSRCLNPRPCALTTQFLDPPVAFVSPQSSGVFRGASRLRPPELGL